MGYDDKTDKLIAFAKKWTLPLGMLAGVAKRNRTPVKKQGEQTMQYRTLGKDLTVSAVGLGCMGMSHAYGAPADKICPVTAIQNRYSMMFRNYEALFGVLEELNIGLVAFSPLANGFLTARYTAESKFDPKEDYRSAMPQFKKEAFAQNGNLLALLEETAKAKTIPGTRKLNRLAENLGAADIVLSAGEVAALNSALDAMTMSAVFGGTRVIKR